MWRLQTNYLIVAVAKHAVNPHFCDNLLGGELADAPALGSLAAQQDVFMVAPRQRSGQNVKDD
jgi:hypothetical protein